MPKVYDFFTGMMVEKGQESSFQKEYDSIRTKDKYTISAMKPDDPKSSRNGFGIYKDGKFVESCESWSEASKRVKELESKETKDLDTAIKSLDAYYDENSGKELRKQDLESMYKKYNGSQVVSELGKYKVGLKNKYSKPGMVDIYSDIEAVNIDLAIKEAVRKNPGFSYSTIKVIKEPKIKLIKNIL